MSRYLTPKEIRLLFRAHAIKQRPSWFDDAVSEKRREWVLEGLYNATIFGEDEVIGGGTEPRFAWTVVEPYKWPKTFSEALVVWLKAAERELYLGRPKIAFRLKTATRTWYPPLGIDVFPEAKCITGNDLAYARKLEQAKRFEGAPA